MISIIIPVYNVAPYLRECLDSVLAQTYVDWEAICVDDGSTDESGAILDEYARRDSRIRVLHQSNGGVSAARNAALKVIQGEWVSFLDGDDIYAPDALRHWMFGVQKYPDCDLVSIRVRCFDDGKVPEFSVEPRDITAVDISEVVPPSEFFKFFFLVLYRANLLSDKAFPPLIVGEDGVFHGSVLDGARSDVLVDYAGYGYRQQENSVSHKRPTLRAFCDDAMHRMMKITIISKSDKVYDASIANSIVSRAVGYGSWKIFTLDSKDRRMAMKSHIKALVEIKSLLRLGGYYGFMIGVLARAPSLPLLWLLGVLPYSLGACYLRARHAFGVAIGLLRR